MKAAIVRIGDSQGIRIPKAIIEECGLANVVEITVEDGKVIISPVSQSRQGWEEAFKEMAENGDDELLIDDRIKNYWDEEDWKW
ncbi:MAG: AbrB/MazE/SpoVT family DNA-binding domain-containing protein [Moorea sp. SIO3I7]|uniref:AbrB/MazE/SpoVT family DNA-binding domain-containing protein n=1 Tax=unclassified Moorena TaxID=2683338 RepID=UPI0013BEFC68|nr:MULTISPECIES: AbrB/MazE/SpoVT family DNA-binding domain-containing protein [unclassified Moorena]NEN95240.1 AbrB/MazE/SpoVT family DNA-binding domain-containing protein [Moorena sp. SIO3I7]NEO05114.1 AbrB/MazE/SpoVT family DNA-binding domain-containing protein [Moorena sp. SIO3I8]NEO18949.1 AbrB/MazE/SpoVT family DNA-binding domain-containing protein [Moorena sp. SIO4A5]NEP21073.1 AbrB/MazE/SpoVT family DNA-binding domain-containing protein [Moorena sp. SIO3I6]NEQ56152.1 AbrB/MazE/SpoVT fam